MLTVALIATVAELYAMQVQYQRELERVEQAAATQASATASALAELLVLARATPTPAPTPDAAQTVGLALSAALSVMRDPQDGRMPALQRLADSGFISLHEREIEHLRQNNLRLSSRSGFQIVRIERVSAESDRASFLTEEKWTYEEERLAGGVVRCLEEVSTQRYELERRPVGWVVAQTSLAGSPARRPCSQ
jgi:hypothetical protein